MADARSRDRVQSIERGMAVLLAFGGHDDTLSVADLTARVDLPRPVVRRILLTFEHLGFVRSMHGRWSVTPRVLELAAGYFSNSSLPELSLPFMEGAVARTGETCSVGVLDGTEVIHVARVEAQRPLPDAVRVGMRLPAHATAIGKVLLAQLPETALADYFASATLEGFAPNTITSESAMRARLEDVRRNGYDVSVDELHPGMVAVAVPVGADGETLGALTASSTSMRSTPESLLTETMPALRDAAAGIARAYCNANPQHRTPRS